MRLQPAIYLEPDDPDASEAEIRMAHIVAADAAMVLLRKTGRLVTVAQTIVRRGADLPDVPMSGTDAVYANTDATLLFLTIASAFPEADQDIVLCFVRGIETDASGLGGSRGGYLAAGTPGLGLLGWANMVSALGDERSPARRIEYGVTVCRALHEMGHVMGLPHPSDSNAVQGQNLDTLMGYTHGAFAEGMTRDGKPVNPDLFTGAEWAVILAHPLLRDAPREWTPAPAGMTGVYGSDLIPIITGKVPPGYALVLGAFIEDYAA